MFYKMIEKGQMRDAQIEAIKTYLFLKICCGCQPIVTLFKSGFFNFLDLNEAEISNITREYLTSHPAAAALYEYATSVNSYSDETVWEVK